jgi:hypothetical protein
MDKISFVLVPVGFYERFGFEFLERKTFADDDCAVYWMPRAAWKETSNFSLPSEHSLDSICLT